MLTTAQFFESKIRQYLPYEPNAEKEELISRLAEFSTDRTADNALFLLNGYAGTGKTSLAGALVKALKSVGAKCQLLAPTGRAAKVFSEFAGEPAHTIHRKIYRQKSYLADDEGAFKLAENKHTDTLFIVDEASMISNRAGESINFGSGHLLDDLIDYVYSGSGCRLMFMGDIAQLPPVGSEQSEAMVPERLRSYGLKVDTFTLRDTARQDHDSGILANATMLRQRLERGELGEPPLIFDRYDDFTLLSPEYMTEVISDCYDHDGLEQAIIITRSNKRASMLNLGVRNRILYREDELTPGDRLLVAKNNYFWSEPYEELDFIANGDMATVTAVRNIESRYGGFRFADVSLMLSDHGVEIDALINIDCLFSETPALSRDDAALLYNNVMDELTGDMRSRYRQLKKHPYFNALQVKYAYAVTCHKAQGGQWKNVFIDMGYIPEEAYGNRDFYRWLYTAITRARSSVKILG